MPEWATDRAKDICARCPVLAECRALGDEVEVGFPLRMLQGVWAGENPEERAIRRSPNTGFLPPPWHETRKRGERRCGTPAGYVRGCKCFPCCEANRYKMAAYRRRRAAGRVGKGPHSCWGKPRCPSCKKRDAKRQFQRRKVLKAVASQGLLTVCEVCGKVETVTDGRSKRRKYCPECKNRRPRAA